MRNRIELILKIACLLLGTAVLFHIVLAILHGNPLAKTSIPAVPSLSTNAPAGAKGTNSITAKPAIKNGTNVQSQELVKAGMTNLPASTPAKSETNPVPTVATLKAGTNSVTQAEVERPATNSVTPPEPAKVETNSLVSTEPPKPATNTVVVSEPSGQGTNAVPPPRPASPGTNLVAVSGTGTNTNSNSVAKKAAGPGPRPDLAAMGMPGMPGMSGKKLPELAPATKARIDRIYESELLGQVMRPMPAALMGIAGNVAFLRSANGQTGSIKEGDSLGDMKLVRIGVNRVLVEEGGQKKELMIFNGYGGESLLSKKETPDETTPK
jgi:hypothetical protein